MPTKLDRMTADLASKMSSLTQSLQGKTITAITWQGEMRRELGTYSTAAWLIGAKRDDVPADGREALIDHLNFQLAHLEEFGAEIQEAEEWRAGWEARAASYAKSIKAPYWEGTTFPLPLPAMPAQGTNCMNNCGCTWRIEVVNAKTQDYDCYWERGKNDSCQTCLQREATWNPLRIRGGGLEIGTVLPEDIEAPAPGKKPKPKKPPKRFNASDYYIRYGGDTEMQDAGEAVLKELDTLHGPIFKRKVADTGTLSIDTDPTLRGTNTLGYYQKNYDSHRQPSVWHSDIFVNPSQKAVSRRLTIRHEVGHWIDEAGFFENAQNKTFASERKSVVALDAWRRAVRNSKGYQKLTQPMLLTSDEWRAYALTDRELFARSYAQWVSLRLNDQEALNELRSHVVSQWTTDDFEPIAKAFDDLFRDMGSPIP